MRRALNQALSGEARSRKVRTGEILALRRAAVSAGVGIGDHGLVAGGEEGEIGQSVADIGEVVAELVAECG